jgi:hypothetical protein
MMERTVRTQHAETLPTLPEDDCGDGRRWSVYLVDRVYFPDAAGPLETSQSLFAQARTFEQAEEARRAYQAQLDARESVA